MTETRSANTNGTNSAPTLSLTETMRGWNDVLSLWRLCDRPACRRARACRGNARVCFPQYFPMLPEGVRAWFKGIGEAQDANWRFDEAIEWLDSTPAGDAFRDWHKAVEASLRPPANRAIPSTEADR